MTARCANSLDQSTCGNVPVAGINVECSTMHGARRKIIWTGVEVCVCSENQIAADDGV